MHIMRCYMKYTVKVTFSPPDMTNFSCNFQQLKTTRLTPLSRLVFILLFFHIVFVLNVFTHTVDILLVTR